MTYASVRARQPGRRGRAPSGTMPRAARPRPRRAASRPARPSAALRESSAAGVRERVEHHVDLAVGGQVLQSRVSRRASSRASAVDPRAARSIQSSCWRALGGVLLATALDRAVGSPARHPGRAPRSPGRLGRDLRQAVERPERDGATLQGRRRGDWRGARRRLEADRRSAGRPSPRRRRRAPPAARPTGSTRK